MSNLKKVLMERDGITSIEADGQISEAIDEIYKGADSEEVLQNNFGLEPDYIFDLIG